MEQGRRSQMVERFNNPQAFTPKLMENYNNLEGGDNMRDNKADKERPIRTR
jgi:hypothetical protein